MLTNYNPGDLWVLLKMGDFIALTIINLADVAVILVPEKVDMLPLITTPNGICSHFLLSLAGMRSWIL